MAGSLLDVSDGIVTESVRAESQRYVIVRFVFHCEGAGCGIGASG